MECLGGRAVANTNDLEFECPQGFSCEEQQEEAADRFQHSVALALPTGNPRDVLLPVHKPKGASWKRWSVWRDEGTGTMATHERLQGGSLWLDSLLYDEAWVPTNVWLDDEYLLMGTSDSGSGAMPGAFWAGEVAPEPWYRWPRKTA